MRDVGWWMSEEVEALEGTDTRCMCKCGEVQEGVDEWMMFRGCSGAVIFSVFMILVI